MVEILKRSMRGNPEIHQSSKRQQNIQNVSCLKKGAHHESSGLLSNRRSVGAKI